jgi:hypothetical protein
MKIRRLLLIAVAYFGPSVAAEAQPISAAQSASPQNISGPTVSQIHQAPLARLPSLAEPQRVGELVRRSETSAPYRYLLPGDSSVVFGGCGSDERCDFVMIVSPLGSGGDRQIEALSEDVRAHNITEGNEPDEQFRVASMAALGAPGGIALVQMFPLRNDSRADHMHDRYSAFIAARDALKDKLASLR